MPTKSGLVSTASRKALSASTFLPIAVGAIALAAPSEAGAQCVTLPGVTINCGGTGTIDLTGSAEPITVNLEDGFVSPSTVNLGTLTGDIDINSAGTTLIETATGPGLVADSASGIEAQITGVTTQDVGGVGVDLTAVEDVLFTADGTIRTVGDLADGVNVEGETVTLDLGTVSTEGEDSDGVEAVALDGPLFVQADLIETEGGLSSASVLRGTGDIGLQANALRTNGTDAVAIDIASDPAACVLAGAGGCDVTAAAEEVTTNGFGGIGALVAATGPTTVDIGVLQTGGDEAAGLDLSADPDACVVLGVGACNTAFRVDQLTTQGFNSPGAVVRAAGDIDGDVGVLRTNGDEAAGLDLATDPDACVVLGPGACDTDFTVGELTTLGDSAPGALVRGTGLTTADVGVLRTSGDEAAGLDLATDPDACVILGAGACGTSFTVGELTTEGGNATGALVRGVGPTTADVGVLRTAGDEAAGLDLASDPDACVILGSGNCGTSFTVGELTTEGLGSTGALIRAAGPVTGDVGLLSTAGDDAAGIDIASDPTACVILGAGACDVGLVADEVTTGGDGAAAVLIDAVGDVTTDLGLLSTDGDDSTALAILTDPTACLAIGPGSCRITAAAEDVDTDGDNSPGVVVDGGEDPIDVDTGTVDTDGDNSPGVDVIGTGPIDVDAGTVDTAGDNSPGIIVDGDDDPVTVTFDEIITAGANSPGVAVSAEGPITVDGGDVTTAGPNSDGILIDGGTGLVTVDVDAITTAGPDADGINVATTTGPQVVRAGPVRTSGLRSNGIVATAAGCGDVSITARDDVVSTQAAAILGSSACRVSVTTAPGAAVTGATTGIGVTSGTGATITVGDSVTATAGSAIDADGAAATVTVASTGSVTGGIDLTDNADVLDNAGTFNPGAGTTDFGAGADLFTNRGRLRVAQSTTLAGLETLANTGTIDMVDGAPDDVLTLPGTFSGGAGSTLAIDVDSDTAGTPADRLVVAGAVTGTTAVRISPVGTGPAVVNATGTLVVDSASAPPGAYTLAEPASAGFVSYSLAQNATGDLLVLALPNALALEPLVLPQVAASFWYHSADAFTQSQAIGGGSGFWAQGYGGSDKRGDDDVSVDIFGTATPTNLRYETDRLGLQVGFGFGGAGSTMFGVTGGYQTGEVDYASATEADFDGWNIGAYLRHAPVNSGLSFQLLGKIDFFDIDPSNGTLFTEGADGKSYGVEGEAGWHFGGSSVDFALNAGLAYVRTDIDDFDASGGTFEFDSAESLRGRIGGRVTGNAGSLRPFADVRLYHEFLGDNEARYASGGFALPVVDSLGTSVRGEVGLAGGLGMAGLHLSAWGEAGDVRGYGLRLGIRF